MGGQQNGMVGMLLPLAMFAAIFYFLIIKPQKKKQKAHDEMLASISRGSTIITAGGFFGVVREILDDSYIVELCEGVKVRILKSSVMMKKSAEGEAEEKPKKKKKKDHSIPGATETEETKPAEITAEAGQPSTEVKQPDAAAVQPAAEEKPAEGETADKPAADAPQQ